MQNKLSDIVNNVSIFYSVHFEEIPFDVIRSAIILAISETQLLARPPTSLEFEDIWNAEVSLLVKKPKRTHRVDKCLRSVVFGLFHDRRGKLSAVARSAWCSIFCGASTGSEPRTESPQAIGVISLSSSTADCWGFLHVRSGSDDATPVFRVVQRSFDVDQTLSVIIEADPAGVPRTEEGMSDVTPNPETESSAPAMELPTALTSPPVLPPGLGLSPAVVTFRKAATPTRILVPGDRHPAVQLPVRPLWKVSITAVSDTHYRNIFLGGKADSGYSTAHEADSEDADQPATARLPSADIEWSIHPGSVTYFANFLATSCVAKTVGLTVDIERDPKSRRIVSIVTNASPRLESFILSIVSQPGATASSWHIFNSYSLCSSNLCFTLYSSSNREVIFIIHFALQVDRTCIS